MVTSFESPGTLVRSHSLTLLGCCHVALAVVYVAARSGSTSIALVEVTMPVVIGIALIGYGFWTASREQGTERADVGLVSGLAGSIFFVLIVLAGIYLQELRTGITVDSLQAAMLGTSVGAGIGVVLGHGYVTQSRQHWTNSQLTRAIDSSMDGIAIYEDDRAIYTNAAYADLYGAPDPEVIEGEDWWTLYTNEARSVIKREVFPAIEERNYWRGQLTGKRLDGSTFPKEVTVTRVVETYVIVVRDVSRQRDREQRIQVLNRVLRHNLRNTLTVIQGHANLLADRAPALETDHVEPIREEIDDLITTANKARGVERTLDRRGDYGLTDPSDAVRSTVDRATAAYPDATVRSHVEESGLPSVDASIVDALDELVDNAVEHAVRPDPTVEISVQSVEYASGTHTEFAVADDGPGIPESERRAVQEGEETPLDHGSGLGLWLVNWIVRNAGGTLQFGEAHGGGTVVTISILDDCAERRPHAADRPAEEREEPSLSGY